MDVVGEDDRAGSGIFDDVAGDMIGFADFPILGIDRPEDDAETVFVVEAFGEGRVDSAVWWAHGDGADACGFYNGVGGLGNFGIEGGGGELGELRVVPAVVGDFVAFVDDALGDIGILGDAFSNDEKCGLDVPLFQHVEEFWGELGVRAVVECHGDGAALDIATVVSVLSRGGWCRNWSRRGNRRFCGVHGLNDRLGLHHNRCLRGGVRRKLGFGGGVGGETHNGHKKKKGGGEYGLNRNSHAKTNG